MEFLLVLAFVLLLITLIGHGIWVALRWFIRQLAGNTAADKQVERPDLSRCSQCKAEILSHATFCGHCGTRKPFGIVAELLKDLAATERQVERFRRAGAIEDDVYEDLKNRLQAERTRLSNRDAPAPSPPPVVSQPPVITQPPPSVTESPIDETAAAAVPPSVVTVSETGV